MGKVLRADKGAQRSAFEKQKKKIFATQTHCGICGQEVDFSLKFPHPLSPCIDHIIPVAKGGHASDINNLQLAHLACNRAKSDKMGIAPVPPREEEIKNNNLPWSMDWSKYKEIV